MFRQIKYINFIFIILMNYITKASSNYRGTQPLLGKVLIGFSGLSAVLSAYYYLKSNSVAGDIQFRKKQLAKPIYVLSTEEMVNPPWNKGNLDQWLYRRVQVTGKPIHRLNCLIPRWVNGKDGYQCVVPLVAKENHERTHREGILFSRGFIPYAYKTIGHRWKIQDVNPQTFVGFVSTLQELQDGPLFSGNAYQQGRLLYNYANLDDLARSSGLKNQKQASVAVVERLYETGDLNERRGKRYSNDADFALDYPYYKTEAGALQLPNMPWDYRNKSKVYLGASLASLIVGASIF